MKDICKIMTEKGLDRQVLEKDGEIVAAMPSPTNSLEPELMKIALEGNEGIVMGYDNTIAHVSGGKDRFPSPSLGHMLLAETLNKLSEPTSCPTKTYVDMGCGAGLLGNYVGKNIEDAKRVIFCDFFLESIHAAFSAYMLNKPMQEVEARKMPNGDILANDQGGQFAHFRVGDVRETLVGERADVAMACPIYIPEICEVFPEAYAIFGSVAKDMGADFYFAHSSLADSHIEHSAELAGAKNLLTLAKKEMPLVIDNFDKNRNTLDAKTVGKLTSKGLRIVGSSCIGFTPLHDLKVSKMEF